MKYHLHNVGNPYEAGTYRIDTKEEEKRVSEVWKMMRPMYGG